MIGRSIAFIIVGVALASAPPVYAADFHSGTTTDGVEAAPASSDITEYPLPTAQAGLLDIAIGPDGNLWFTEWVANRIGRLTIAGEFTEWPVPSPIRIYGPIAFDGDGNLWFISGRASESYPIARIAKFAPGGVVMDFRLSDGPTPVGLASRLSNHRAGRSAQHIDVE